MSRCLKCGKEHSGICVFIKGVSAIEDLKATVTKNTQDIEVTKEDVELIKTK